jgi:RPA family protein
VSGREPAWRVFAQELLATTEEERGSGERAASYVITPVGARANRVLVAGRIGPPESMGRDPSAPFFRASLADPTGSLSVTAGGFQPRALGALQRQRPDELVLVVGKATLYRPREGAASPSVRVEALRRIDRPEYHRWLSETLDHTLRRLALVDATRKGQPPDPDPWPPALWIAGAKAAAQRYQGADPPAMKAGLLRVLDALDGAPGSASASPPSPPPLTGDPAPVREVKVTRSVPETRSIPAPSAAARAEEAAFLDIVDELSDASADGYADLKEAMGLAGRRGMTFHRAEEILNSLEENGALEEPLVGKIRRA